MSTYEIPVDVIERMGNGDFEAGLAKLQTWAHQADRRHIRKLQSMAGHEGGRIRAANVQSVTLIVPKQPSGE